MSASASPRRWHNPLPRWIEDHRSYLTLGLAGRSILRAVADACDPPDAAGHLVGAFGGAGLWREAGVGRSTFWRIVKRLEQLGFIVLLARGGPVRMHTRRGVIFAANTWGIPGFQGGLDEQRRDREAVHMLRDAGGRTVREVIRPGQQATLWPKKEVVPQRDYPSPTMGLSPSRVGTLPSPIPSPFYEKHDHVVFTNQTRERTPTTRDGLVSKETRRPPHPQFVRVDLEDPIRRMVLYERFGVAGWVSSSESDKLWFFSAAEHALRVGRDACGMFVSLIRRRGERCLWVSIADEEAGTKALRRARTAT